MATRIIGTMPVNFKSADGTEISGMTIFCADSIDPKRGEGEEAYKLFLTADKLSKLGYTLRPGDTVNLIFNRHGKIERIEPLTDDQQDQQFGFGNDLVMQL